MPLFLCSVELWVYRQNNPGAYYPPETGTSLSSGSPRTTSIVSTLTVTIALDEIQDVAGLASADAPPTATT